MNVLLLTFGATGSVFFTNCDLESDSIHVRRVLTVFDVATNKPVRIREEKASDSPSTPSPPSEEIEMQNGIVNLRVCRDCRLDCAEFRF